jgi:hypothetical protein
VRAAGVTPAGLAYTFEAPARFDRLFTGLVVPRSAFAANPDTGIRPEDVYYNGEDDADYGRMLERAAQQAANRMPFLREG